MIIGVTEVPGGLLERAAGDRLDAALERAEASPSPADLVYVVQIERSLIRELVTPPLEIVRLIGLVAPVHYWDIDSR